MGWVSTIGVWRAHTIDLKIAKARINLAPETASPGFLGWEDLAMLTAPVLRRVMMVLVEMWQAYSMLRWREAGRGLYPS